MSDTLARLRQRLDRIGPAPRDDKTTRRIPLGCAEIDAALDGGLATGLLHEALAAGGNDGPAAAGFAAALAQRTGKAPVVWVRQRFGEAEAGALHAPGLAAMGLDPGHLTLVHARHPRDLLTAGLEAVRCPALGAVVLEAWGNSPLLDLTATRRLMLAAEASAVTTILLRVASDSARSVAFTRWQVGAAPSRALPADAPGLATFDITLLRNRAGPSGQRWRVEWDHGQQRFRPAAPIPRRVVPLPQRRPAVAPDAHPSPLARTG